MLLHLVCSIVSVFSSRLVRCQCRCRCCCRSRYRSHSPFRLPLFRLLVISLSHPSIAFLLAWLGFCWLSFWLWLLVCVNFSFIEHGNFFELFFCSHDMCGTYRQVLIEICVLRIRTKPSFFFFPFFHIHFELSHFCAILCCYSAVAVARTPPKLNDVDE